MSRYRFATPLRSLLFALLLAAWGTPGRAEPATEDAAEPLPPDIATRDFGHDWPTFLGPAADGKSRETGLDFDWPAEGPPIVWQTPLGTSYSGPSISRGRLFHFDRHGDQDRLTCRVAETGEQLWAVSYPTDYEDLLGYNNGPRCSPVVDGARVYTLSAEGVLRCASASDGGLLWEVDTTERFRVVKNFFGVGSTPLVVGGHVIVNVGGSPADAPRDVYAARGAVPANGAGVAAFDKLDGKVVWTCADELASYASPVAADIEGRPWCFVFARGGLVALNPQTGEIDFQYPWRAKTLESVNASSPVVVGDEVFISETYGPGSSLLRVRPGAFDIVWRDDPREREKSMQLHWNTAIHHEGYLYGSSGRHSNGAELRCVEWSTGEVKWRQESLGRCSLLYADGHLICLAESGELHVLKATPGRYELVRSVTLRDATGKQLLEPYAWTAPVLARGLLYLRGDDRLVCIDLAKN
ncbi:outer membrane biogenesis protein BamB [Posidoniimonas corsicana]|uniref:Outer membrane biogenesis protein BamB n=1 Tax=Posidoniimonas corsicana TaxID=1938618 RepID=A0A5C5V2X1_9BACT|nr:PQQ-binding-like beta-propeller repeat protein [Posidoniimonas corsicana]TWT32340.1 outer membrane biogenesis protein BamB [Posidoniimonas corsicana]